MKKQILFLSCIGLVCGFVNADNINNEDIMLINEEVNEVAQIEHKDDSKVEVSSETKERQRIRRFFENSMKNLVGWPIDSLRNSELDFLGKNALRVRYVIGLRQNSKDVQKYWIFDPAVSNVVASAKELDEQEIIENKKEIVESVEKFNKQVEQIMDRISYMDKDIQYQAIDMLHNYLDKQIYNPRAAFNKPSKTQIEISFKRQILDKFEKTIR